MMPTTKRSLRVTIITPFLLGLLALTVCLAYYTHSSTYRALEESVRLLSRSQTRNVYNSMSLLFRSMSTSVEKLTTDPHVTDLFTKTDGGMDSDRENWFEILIQGNEYYRGILIVDKEGVCIASNSQMQEGVSYADKAYVQRALQGEALISDAKVGIVTKNLSVTAAAPIFINGEIMGAVVMINDFPEIVNYESDEGEANATLFPAFLAPDGSFIAHKDKSFVTSGKKYPELYVELLAARSGDYVEYTLEGREYVGYAMLEPSTRWIVCSSGPESEVFSYAERLTKTIILGSLAALVVISFLVIRVVNGVLNSLLSLITYAKQVSEGDLSLKLRKSRRRDELGTLNASLQSLVSAMRKMVVQSQEASQLKSQFLANMSHEIRTPLNAVIGMAHLYLTYGDNDPEKKRDYVVKIQSAARSLLGIINNILDISKIEAGMFELDSIPFNLRETVEQVLFIHQENAGAKGLELCVNYAPDLPDFFVGDPVRIGQVLNNLTGNALKFTKEGKVSIFCCRDRSDAPDAASPDVAPGPEGGWKLRISVADTGIGIPKEKQSLLFQPFSQADASITRQFGGTGLGLAISRSIVAMMGGSFDLASEAGQGTTFSFTMYLVPAEGNFNKAEDDAADSMDSLHLEGKRILVAEDNEINQLLMEELLASTGAEVVLVENGLLAVEAVKDGRFDLVLMDMQMPVMGGIEAAKEIRSFASQDELPIVAVTANAMKEDKEMGVAAGLNDYITKPIDPEQLILALKRWLS